MYTIKKFPCNLILLKTYRWRLYLIILVIFACFSLIFCFYWVVLFPGQLIGYIYTYTTAPPKGATWDVNCIQPEIQQLQQDVVNKTFQPEYFGHVGRFCIPINICFIADITSQEFQDWQSNTEMSFMDDLKNFPTLSFGLLGEVELISERSGWTMMKVLPNHRIAYSYGRLKCYELIYRGQ